MRKGFFVILLCAIFAQSLSFTGCTSKREQQETTQPAKETNAIMEATEATIAFEIIDGDFLDQYTVPPIITEETTVEETVIITEPMRESNSETYPSPEPTEVQQESDDYGFIPGENETPGDPL